MAGFSYPSDPERNEVQRVRQDAFQDHFNSGATRVYSTDSLGLPVDPGSHQGTADRTGLARALSQSSVPLQHLNGVQFVHVLKAGLGEGVAAKGKYFPGHRTLALDGDLDSPDPVTRGQGVRSAVHEIGHHVENMATNGRLARGGRSEGLAENYADEHVPDIPVTHMGVTVYHRPTSNYDTHVPNPGSSVWQTPADRTGEVNHTRYVNTRATGTMPDGS